MAQKVKGRIPPRIETELLRANFAEQCSTGAVVDASCSGETLPALVSARGQAAHLDRCMLHAVTLSHPEASRLRARDIQVAQSDLANINLAGCSLERVEFTTTRLTGAIWTEARLKSVLFRECKLDLALFRMATLQDCVFENCRLSDADLYGADLTGAIFRDCDLSRADLSHARLARADIRNCRLDGLRGAPASMEGLLISPDQAPLLIGLFGVEVRW